MASFPVRNLDELREILYRLNQRNPLIAMMVEFEVRTGLRYSDLSKLEFKHVMINGTIKESFTVVQAKTYSARIKKGISHRAATEASKINISVSKELRELIHRVYVRNGHHDLLFQSNHHHAKAGSAISIQYINKQYREIAGELSLPYKLTTHSMRKTFVQLLLEQGADLDVCSEALGHSSLVATKSYLNTFTDKKKKFTDSITLGLSL